MSSRSPAATKIGVKFQLFVLQCRAKQIIHIYYNWKVMKVNTHTGL